MFVDGIANSVFGSFLLRRGVKGWSSQRALLSAKHEWSWAWKYLLFIRHHCSSKSAFRKFCYIVLGVPFDGMGDHFWPEEDASSEKVDDVQTKVEKCCLKLLAMRRLKDIKLRVVTSLPREMTFTLVRKLHSRRENIWETISLPSFQSRFYILSERKFRCWWRWFA